MEERHETVIVGGGHAGLAMSHQLSRRGRAHVVLERGRVAERWRSERWDSLHFQFPNWSLALPGQPYDGPQPDGFSSRDEVVAFIERYCVATAAPVRTGVRVDAIRRGPGTDGFRLETSHGIVVASNVVVATGPYQEPVIPAPAGGLPARIAQMHSSAYRNPAGLPPGAVLVVGSGQTGCQLAEELHQSGRKVFLACGRCVWVPRRMDGRDAVWWMAESGYLDRTPDLLPSPAARLLGNPQATGHDGGRDLNYRVLHDLGVELLGRYAGADGSTLHFEDDLAASVDFGDARLLDLLNFIKADCARKGTTPPTFDMPTPLRIKTRTELDVAQDGIASVIWTSGYRPDYGWVKLPVFDGMGFPEQRDGCTTVPGLYFMGVHWMRKNKSPILYGVGEDAGVVAQHIVEARS